MIHGPANPTLAITPNTPSSREINLRNTKYFASGECASGAEIRNSTFFELNKLIRFVIVGGATFVFQFCVYWICSRILMPDIARLPVYMLSLGYAIVGNYTAHRLWTFRDQKCATGSTWRYAFVVFCAVSLNAGIFHLGVNLLLINDLIVVIIAESLIPLITYAGHRFYTFR
jgi:putative flippase GtrA